jgi:hypothetical protein
VEAFVSFASNFCVLLGEMTNLVYILHSYYWGIYENSLVVATYNVHREKKHHKAAATGKMAKVSNSTKDKTRRMSKQ